MNPINEKIERALAGVQHELASHALGTGTVSTPDQLKRVERELVQMLEEAKLGQYKSDRSGLGRMVVDSWPLGHELTERVCAAVDAYSAAAKRSPT